MSVSSRPVSCSGLRPKFESLGLVTAGIGGRPKPRGFLREGTMRHAMDYGGRHLRFRFGRFPSGILLPLMFRAFRPEPARPGKFIRPHDQRLSDLLHNCPPTSPSQSAGHGEGPCQELQDGLHR